MPPIRRAPPSAAADAARSRFWRLPESSVSAKLTIESSPGFLDVELLPRLLPKTTGRRLVQERLYITTPREHSFVPGDSRRRVIPHFVLSLSSSGGMSPALGCVGNIAM